MDSIKELFFTPMYKVAFGIWNACIDLLASLLGVTPKTLAGGGIWDYISNSIYPIYLTIGVSLMTLYWLVNYCRENANFKEKVTLEKLFTSLLQLLAANIVLVNSLRFIGNFFTMASHLSDVTITVGNMADYASPDLELKTVVTYFVFGIFFFITSAACGVSMLYAVYRRFLNLYLLMPMAPVALAGIAGGRGINQTAFAWIRTFLGCTFEIVVIALAINIAQRMINGGVTALVFRADSDWNFLTQPLEAMMTMFICAGSVKGAETLLRRAFGL